MDINSLTIDELQELLAKVRYENTYHRLGKVELYQWQKDFMNASKKFKQRYLRSGNRCGKSLTEAHEFAYHLTGLYPEWWDGLVIAESGHYFWAIGIDLDSTANVMQKELFGTKDIRLTSEVGTGTIPRSCIEIDTFTKDGRRLSVARIKHIDGGFNTVQFYAAAQGQDKLMGQSTKYVWMDEEAASNSDEIYAQCLTRTLESEGHIAFTSTPEQGLSSLNVKFEEDDTGKLYIQQATWDDCIHITPDMEAEMLAGIPTYQHDMRRNGLPVIGSGAVFPVKDEDVVVKPFLIPDHWKVCKAIDIGKTSDSSTWVQGAYDPDGDCYYIIEEWEGDNAKDPLLGAPTAMAASLKSNQYSTAPIVVPHDAGLNSSSPEAYARQLIKLGCSVHRQSFRNPVDLKLGLFNIDQTKTHNAREPGLAEMRWLMETGKLKVFNTCINWLREKRSYYYKADGKTSKPDHTLDASRYCIMSLRGNVGNLAVHSKGQSSMNEGIPFNLGVEQQ
jgi:phage terminase large subunit-like protein